MKTENQKPNVVLIILDSARKDMFGCYGNKENLTPNIDALAKRGLVLRSHYAAGCGSAQAHVSIFAGQHSIRHKMVHNFCDLRNDLVTISSLLKKLGYKTFGYTKFNIVPPAGHAELFGFDELIDPQNEKKTVRARAPRWSGLKKIAGSHPKLKKILANIYDRTASRDLKLRIRADSMDGRNCLGYLVDRLRENKAEGPVFVYMTLPHPHMPYYPPKRFLDEVFKGASIHKKSYDIQFNIHAYTNGNFGKIPEALESVKKCYKADLLYADFMIGEAIEKLEKESLLDNTIFVIMADHGELLGEHGRMNHGSTVWEELFNIPCIIYYPKKIKPDSSIYNLTSALDIFPTVFDLIGQKDWAKGQTVLDGVSIFEEGFDWKARYLVVDSPPIVFPERLKNYKNLLKRATIISRALRTPSYKYIWQSNGDNRLYTVGSEELLHHNLLPQKKDLEKKFLDALIGFYTSVEPNFKIDEYPVNLSKLTAEKIRDPYIRNELIKLGYLTEEDE